MKTIIIIVLLTFIAASGFTMFFTGTFKSKDPAEQLPGEDGDTSAEIAGDVQEEKTNTQEDPNTHAPVNSEAKTARHSAQIAEQEKKLAALRSEIASLTTAQAAIARTQQFQDLAKVYSSMKPDSAASILAELEDDLAMRIMKGMNTKTAGKIMEALATSNPSYAAKLSKLIADS